MKSEAAQNDFRTCIRLCSGELSVRRALLELMAHLEPLALCTDDLSSVELVLGEVLNNVVEHAYGPGVFGMITVEYVLKDRQLWFSVKDAGDPLPDESLPDRSLPSLDGPLESLPEGGFGWFMVRKLANDLCYRREPGENVLEFGITLEV